MYLTAFSQLHSLGSYDVGSVVLPELNSEAIETRLGEWLSGFENMKNGEGHLKLFATLAQNFQELLAFA